MRTAGCRTPCSGQDEERWPRSGRCRMSRASPTFRAGVNSRIGTRIRRVTTDGSWQRQRNLGDRAVERAVRAGSRRVRSCVSLSTCRFVQQFLVEPSRVLQRQGRNALTVSQHLFLQLRQFQAFGWGQWMASILAIDQVAPAGIFSLYLFTILWPCCPQNHGEKAANMRDWPST